MQRKLTITMDEAVYEALNTVIGRRNISRFLTDLARPHVIPEALEDAYREIALQTRSARNRRSNTREGWSEAQTMTMLEPKRGDVWWVAFDSSVGGETKRRYLP